MKVISFVLLLCLSACATGPSQEEIHAARQAEVELWQKRYYDCAMEQAGRIIADYDSPQYIAHTAHSMCGTFFRYFDQSVKQMFMNMPGDNFERKMWFASDTIEGLRVKTENDLIRLVTEVKLKAKPTQAKPKSAPIEI